MALAQRSIVFAGMVGGWSILVGVGVRDPVPTPAPSAATVRNNHASSSGVRWLSSVPDHGRVNIAVPDDPTCATFLVITAWEPVRQKVTLNVTVDEHGSAIMPIREWNRDELVADSVPELTATPIRVVGEPSADAVSSPESTSLESWFLPSGRPGACLHQTLQTREIEQTSRVRIVLDCDAECDLERQQWCQRLAQQLTNALIPRVEAVFGAVADRETDGKLTVVVTPRVRQVHGGGTAVEAFVLASDYRLDLSRPHSNERDVVYVHPDVPADTRDAILIHELVHAAQFCALRREYGGTPWPVADWILEGTAHAAEVLLSGNDGNVRHRLEAFAANPERSPLVIVDAAREGRWRDLHCRGAASSFFTWLVRRNGINSLGSVVNATGFHEAHAHAASGPDWLSLRREWHLSLIAENAVAMRELRVGMPTVITIDGGAAAFLALPSARDSTQPLTVTVSEADHHQWEAMVVQMPFH